MKLFTLTFITLALLAGCNNKPEPDFQVLSVSEVRRARPDLSVVGSACWHSFLGVDGWDECAVFAMSHPSITVRCRGTICTCTDYVCAYGIKHDFDATRWKLVPITQQADPAPQDH